MIEAMKEIYVSLIDFRIQRQSRSNQIIVISHKPQTISLSDRFLKTSIVNQTTAVTPTDQRDALLISQVVMERIND